MPKIPFKKKSVILVCGHPQSSFLARLKKRTASAIVVMEGRPDLTPALRVCEELAHGTTPTVIADNMAGFLFSQGLVKEAWLTYRSASQEGVLCSMGGLIVAVLGKRHKVPVFCFPCIRADEVSARPNNIFYFEGERIAPSGIGAFVPLLEWIPRKYVRKIYE